MARSTPLRSTRTRSGDAPSATSRRFKPAGNRDKAGRVSRRPSDPSPRNRIGRDQIEIGPATRDDDGAAQRPTQQHRGYAVRVEVMRIDQVEIPAVPDLLPQSRQNRRKYRQRRRTHSDLRQQRITRMIDFDTMARFVCAAFARMPNMRRISATTMETRDTARQPGPTRRRSRPACAAGFQQRSRASAAPALGYNVVNVRIRKLLTIHFRIQASIDRCRSTRTPTFSGCRRGWPEYLLTSAQQSFFALPQWYDLMARFGVGAGTEIRVYADERPNSSAAVLLQECCRTQPLSLLSLANFYSVEHGPISPANTAPDRGLDAIFGEILADRPRWDCIRLLELDLSEESHGALVRALRRAGLFVECTRRRRHMVRDDRRDDLQGLPRRTPVATAQHVAPQAAQSRRHKPPRRFILFRTGRDRCRHRRLSDRLRGELENSRGVPAFHAGIDPARGRIGALRMGVYYIDGAPAASQFWILWRGRAVIYKLAHDSRLDKLSLGTLLTMEMVERVLEQDRPEEINFGRGDDPYKRLWLPRRRQRWGITAANPRTARGLRLGLEREAAKLYHRMRGEPVTPQAS